MLPTNRDVLKTFVYHREVCKKTIPESAKCTSDELMAIWMKARIPTTCQQHIVKEYSLIKKKKAETAKHIKVDRKILQKKLISCLTSLIRMLTAYLELVNDLLLFKQTEQYAVINKTFSDATTKTIRNHLWYLGSELVPFALFSSKISAYEKRLMAQAMADSVDDWSV